MTKPCFCKDSICSFALRPWGKGVCTTEVNDSMSVKGKRREKISYTRIP